MKGTTTSQSRPLNVPNHSKGNAPKTLPINSERQYRLILAILQEPKATNDLIRIVKANNVPDVVMNLRGHGWEIQTEYETVNTSDGETVRAGQYRLITDTETAKASLKSYKGAK